MKPRLVRALQRGGMAVQLDIDRWGVWRGRDRRGRMIGVVSGAEIDVLRIRESLQPCGDGHPTILIWSGSVLDPAPVAPSAKRLDQVHPSTHGPLIELILSRCHDLDLRRMIRETVQAYRADIQCAARAGVTRGMNWEGLALGGKIDGGFGPQMSGPSAAMRAQSALSIIHTQLGSDAVEFLDRMILCGDSRAKMARRFGSRPSLIESRAIAIMRALNDAYRIRVRA